MVGLSLTSSQTLADDHGDKIFEIYGELEVRAASWNNDDLDTFVDETHHGMRGNHPLQKFDELEARWQIEYGLPLNSLATNNADRGDTAGKSRSTSSEVSKSASRRNP